MMGILDSGCLGHPGLGVSGVLMGIQDSGDLGRRSWASRTLGIWGTAATGTTDSVNTLVFTSLLDRRSTVEQIRLISFDDTLPAGA